MQKVLSKLDPASELLALATHGNTKNIVATAVEVRGPFDDEIGRLAMVKASKGFPQVRSCIKEVRVGGKYHLVWDHRPDLSLPIISSEMTEQDVRVPFLDNLLNHLSTRLDREWNLTEEVALEIQFVRVTKEHHVLVCSFHHAASDAGTASEFGREFLRNYHKIKTGKEPEWAYEAHAISTSRKRRARITKRNWKEVMGGARRSLENLLDRPTGPVGSGLPGDTRQFHEKRILSEDDTDLIGKLARTNGVSPVDLFTACVNIAVDQWNQARNLPPGLLTSSMTVNTRGRVGTDDQPNNSSVIFFRSKPEDRADLTSYFRSLALTRINHFRKHVDVKYMRDIERMMNAIRVLPFKMRRGLVHHVVGRHNFSVAITLLGVIWPKNKNGKPTAETALTRTADLTVTEVHGIGYKLLSNTHVLLIVYAFKSRLNLILACSADLFTREEATAFMDLIVANCLETPRKILQEKNK